MSIFRSPEIFEEADVMIYGEYKKVAYYCANFLWKPVDCLIRFVWVIDGDHYYVLMCSDLQLCPTQIIAIYSYRWKIGVSREGHMHPVGESPTEVRSSNLVAWEAPWREIKTVEPSDTMLFGSMRKTPGCNVQ
jgi:hypothetical protein